MLDETADKVSCDPSSAFDYSTFNILIFSFLSKNTYATSDTIRSYIELALVIDVLDRTGVTIAKPPVSP